MKTLTWPCVLLVGTLLAALAAGPAQCAESNADDHAAVILSDSVTPLAILGTLSFLANRNKQVGKQEALQTAKAMAATAFATEALKLAVHEQRPSGSSSDSFPSGHTSEAFAMATMWAKYQPKYAWEGYATAAAIGWSRVEQDKHYWKDVIAGAALGHFIASRFANQHIYAGPDGIGVQYKF